MSLDGEAGLGWQLYGLQEDQILVLHMSSDWESLGKQ